MEVISAVGSLDESRRKVFEFIDESTEEFLEFLGDYIRIKSVNPRIAVETSDGPAEVKTCQEWLYNTLDSWNIFSKLDKWEVEPGQPNIAAILSGTAKGDGESLMFNGHSDTVDVTAEQLKSWTGPGPWSGIVKDGRVWGRGAGDMKAGVAAYLWAARAIAETNTKLGRDVLLTAVIGEESGSREIGIDSVMDRGYHAPLCILAEPSATIAPVNVGEFYFRIKVVGQSSHIADRHLAIYPNETGVVGVNAIEKMMKIIQSLQTLEREWGLYQKHPLMPIGGMTLNFSIINGGDNFSSLAQSCEVVGSVLFNPSLSSEEVIAEFQGAIDAVCACDYWLRNHAPEVTIPIVLPVKEPVNMPLDHPGISAMCDSFRDATGKEPEVTCMSGTSDGNYMFERGQAVITYGPGGGADSRIHGSCESVSVDEVVEACKTYAAMMLRWCGV